MTSKTYNTQRLNLEQKKKILTEAIANSNKVWVDDLDCSKSWARQPSKTSVSEMINQHLSSSCHFVIIERNLRSFDGSDESFVEFGFSTMGRVPELYLFIQVETQTANKIITSYNLTVM